MIKYNVMENLDFYSIKNLIPKRKDHSHKGDFGSLLAICGSSKYRGAAALACESALRCGVGLLTLCSTEKVISAVASRLPEATFFPCDEGENGEIKLIQIDSLIAANPRTSAVLCGCGLTNTPLTKAMVYDLIENSDLPLVLDADALNCIGANISILKKARKTPIVTPHLGEFSRLCGLSIEQIKKDTENIARAFATETKCLLVLKSHKTLVADTHGDLFELDAPNPGLSRGGSGDLLAGMISSFRAQGLSALNSAKSGVALHSAAAQRTRQRLGTVGMLPHDIIFDMISILKESEI